MNHRATADFWRCYDALSVDVRGLADRAFDQLKQDPKHPSLHFKNVGAFWSARVGAHYRAISIREGETWVWFWIGTHAAYDRLLNRR